MAGFDNDVIYGSNIDLSGAGAGRGGSATLLTDGQLLIATTAANAGGTHVNVGILTSPDSSITFGYSSPNITAIVNPAALTYYSLTPYIVGQTGDTHAQYTGNEGIQAAINQAVADGHTSVNPANIYIKAGSYSPASGFITARDGINLYSFENYTGQPAVFGSTVFASLIVTDATTNIDFNGISFENDTLPAVDFIDSSASDACYLNFVNCVVFLSQNLIKPKNGIGIVSQVTFNGGQLFCGNSFGLFPTTIASIFTFYGYNTVISANETDYNDVAAQIQVFLDKSKYTGNFAISGSASGDIELSYSLFQGDITSTTIFPVVVALVNSNLNSQTGCTVVSFESTIGFKKISEYRTITGYASNPTLSSINYIAAMDTTAARTVTLPAGADGLTYIIKDETGTAATFNITINPNGTEKIDNASSYVISSNLGSVTLSYRATTTNWLVT